MLERIKKFDIRNVDWKKINYPKIVLTAVFLLAMFLLGRAVGAATHGTMAVSAVASAPENWGLDLAQREASPAAMYPLQNWQNTMLIMWEMPRIR